MQENAGISEGAAAEPTPASPEQLASELAQLLRPGITTKSLVSAPTILALAVVRAKAASDDVHDPAAAARGLLREVAVVVDGERNGPVAMLLGLATASRGVLLKVRRQLVADLLQISAAHLRTSGREDQLIETLADELYAADSAYRLRHRHRTKPEQEAPASRLGVDWLDRHQAYRRVWTPLHALRNDLWVLLKFLHEGVDRDNVIDRLMNLAWRWAQFQLALERFVADYGGLWLLADVDSEYAAADAIQRIEFLVPFGEADDSWLRLILKDTREGELDPFMDRMGREELGPEILKGWLDWVKQCDCALAAPDTETCVVHRWIAAVDEFTALINADWLAVADWYRLNSERAPEQAGIEGLWRKRR